MFIVGLFVGAVLLTSYQFFLPARRSAFYDGSSDGNQFGWKIPTLKYLPSGQVIDSAAYSQLRDPSPTPKGLPVRLVIPSIGVNSAIEDAYITPDGRMDVPAGSVNVAWYALGFRPGQNGSAVIGGHFGIDNGVPKVFYDLNKLKVGDKVYIADDQKKTLAFQVRSIKLFGRNDDSTPVFVSKDGLAHLNLITCEGIWNKVEDSYPDRRVVFTDAIPPEAIPEVTRKITPRPTATLSPNLSPAAAVTYTASVSTPTATPPSMAIQNIFTNLRDWFIYITDF
ncbi:MAG: Peptidase C60 sortase A and B [Candidatus Collierbacteria bacterium GW2011_GWD2_45_10]|uniref:Peptidase C60 sortase A and B n=1 Tax=Candidatus Collierbacteria bacterium GW2011_GWB2_44_22 TaxID=1618387 RepID=A0A0G1K7L8_9BACT|nr:MAG: Peptidase C60 sortase A and B [Candidatus Collierbacteria bacterium GW2011_GWA2_44_13]KKT52292.1 MAG: Peptidase C60 sortase A and B [Candidatus Collierbacteria bacterium GW2011_GWB2_44_22]KKT63212.1 MAG: Peptidase C60 sortase A and B [Candidatus Collierbacteria bacterium GW2011_GWD1_44_27]KKT66122.1 MAG: Peptidase C60 sortase A and B [Candidatus Collierbacteria bacterium GW2011_GWC2_44_30]KKT88995.1 MAG: Peptidase C60 sortase A and B [Candidatus Collierbacteria bacterium GW2011_GWD2_45_